MLTAERQKLTELAVAASAASASASDIVSSFALKLPARYDSSEVLNIFFGEMPATLAARASCALVGGYSTMPTWSYATSWLFSFAYAAKPDRECELSTLTLVTNYRGGLLQVSGGVDFAASDDP